MVYNKIPYKRWQEFRNNLRIIQNHVNSWTEVSARFGKSEAGWAKQALEHRSIVTAGDVVTSNILVKELEMEQSLTRSEKQEVLDMINTALNHPKVKHSKRELARLLGKGLTWVTNVEARNGGTSRESYNKLKEFMMQLQPLQVDKVQEHEQITPQEPTPQTDPFAWVSEIRDEMFQLAVRVDTESRAIPERFRTPYKELADQLTDIAESLQRSK